MIHSPSLLNPRKIRVKTFFSEHEYSNGAIRQAQRILRDRSEGKKTKAGIFLVHYKVKEP